MIVCSIHDEDSYNTFIDSADAAESFPGSADDHQRGGGLLQEENVQSIILHFYYDKNVLALSFISLEFLANVMQCK